MRGLLLMLREEGMAELVPCAPWGEREEGRGREGSKEGRREINIVRYISMTLKK
jgi:hypothetical protein